MDNKEEEIEETKQEVKQKPSPYDRSKEQIIKDIDAFLHTLPYKETFTAQEFANGVTSAYIRAVDDERKYISKIIRQEGEMATLANASASLIRKYNKGELPKA